MENTAGKFRSGTRFLLAEVPMASEMKSEKRKTVNSSDFLESGSVSTSQVTLI